MLPPWIVAAAAVAAAAVGAASGAGLMKLVKDRELSDLRAAQATERLDAVTAARKDERDAQIRAAAVRDQRPLSVRCQSTGPAGVPGAGPGAPVGGVPDSRDSGDIGPALHAFLAAERANRRVTP